MAAVGYPGSPLVSERWKRIQTIAVKALAHAKEHGDVGYLVSVANALPSNIQSSFFVWVGAFSPIILIRREGKIISHRRKIDDPYFVKFDVEQASSTPILNFGISRPSPGDRFAKQIIEKEFGSKNLRASIEIIRVWFNNSKIRNSMQAHLESSHLSDPHQISLCTHAQLMEIYKKCVQDLTDSDLSDKPDKIRRVIFAEWRRRNGQSLVDDYFDWPSTDAPIGTGQIGAIPSPLEGMLNAFGYHVGKTSVVSERARRLILDDIFSVELPPLHSRDYMREWNEPKSARRLHKIADTLASLARNEKRRGLLVAPQERESDLEYLHQTYYIGKFKFVWATT